LSESPRLAIRVTVVGPKATLYELMLDKQKVLEFKGRHEVVDFLMQATSALRYD
jgi:hypothetical protein